MDAGHFISRDCNLYRYHVDNVWPQCRACNRFHEGRKQEYTLWMIERFGIERVEEMVAQRKKPHRLTEADLLFVIENMKAELKGLK